MSDSEPHAWIALVEEEERLALARSWPSSRDGGVQFVVDETVLRLDHDERLALYQDLSEKMLAVFRALVPPGGWLYALDPHHPCYRFFPHVPFEAGATLEQMTGLYSREHFALAERGIHPPPLEPRWAMEVHPAGDPEHAFASPDFHFVFAARYRVGNLDGGEAPGRGPLESETYELLGRPLVEAVERDLPELFRRARRCDGDS
ncbi:hypothetical protein DRW03_21415 [Corallococcus sp. H22C18031201]|uniref:DUF2716 domain-containing protein n=1 Tax=Citreicoccus inhibens TaxID=2849499 RepID=UPI000E73D987|nr:DUF2716 domain-containing protein [Citreicoccus inhibens]MBU8897500.1 DUF2716 domain-containing protein [Citreicoccus inhibens]RJS19592.1 hypothetical protein DRW03_21415 [Corallococcus sp. H22C18031201]